jgi:hypothetical protein
VSHAAQRDFRDVALALGHPSHRHLSAFLMHEYNRIREKSMAGRRAAQIFLGSVLL